MRICGVFGVRRYSFPLRKFINISFACMFLSAVTSPSSLYYYFCNVALLQPVIHELRTLVSTKVVFATCSVNTALSCRSPCSVLVCYSVFNAPAVNAVSLCMRCVHSNLL